MTDEAVKADEPPDVPKKRKKKRSGAEAPALPPPPSSKKPAVADPRAAWPSFARSFPDHPKLAQLVKAFEDGNYLQVRRDAQRLIDAMKAKKDTIAQGGGHEGKPSSPLPKISPLRPEERRAIQRAAEELLIRLEPPKLSVLMLLGSVILLVFLAVWYWTHPGASP